MKTASSWASPYVSGAPSAIRSHEFAPLHLAAGLWFGLRGCLTFLAFQADPRTGSAVSLVLGGLLFAATAIYTLGTRSNDSASLLKSRTLRWLIAYLSITGGSVFWTGSASPAVAAGYWAGMVIDVATIVVLLKAPNKTGATRALMSGFVVGALIQAAIAWSLPTLSDLRIGNEDFLHPNSLGLLFALAFFLAQHLAKIDHRWRWPMALLAISLLRTISKSSIIAFVLVESLYLISDKQLSRRIKRRIAALAVLILLVFGSLISSYLTLYSEQSTSAETLTGRTVIWLSSWVMATETPWFGHGIYSYRYLIPAFGDLQPVHAHNELLQQFFEYGIVGVIITVGLYVSLLRSARRSPNNPYSRLAIALTLFCIIRGLADTINFGLSLPIWLFALLAIAIQHHNLSLSHADAPSFSPLPVNHPPAGTR